MKKRYLTFLPTLMMLLSACSNYQQIEKKNALEPDNAIYDKPAIYQYGDTTCSYKPPIRKAATQVSKVIIHYHNDDAQNKTRTFWVWAVGVNGKMYNPVYSDDGKDMTLTLNFNGEEAALKNNISISFIIRNLDSWAGQSVDVKVDFKVYTPDNNGLVELWCIPGEGNDIEVYTTEEETKADRAVFATFEDWKKIKVIASAAPTSYRVYAFTANYFSMNRVLREQNRNNYIIKEGNVTETKDVKYNSNDCKQFDISLKHTIRTNAQYIVETIYSSNPNKWQSKSVSFDNLYETERFNQYYTYDGNDLGVTYTPEATTFKVWAPTASNVRLMLYDSGIPEEYTDTSKGRIGSDSWGGYDMSYQPGGIWQVTISGKDLNKRYYNYSVTNSLGTNEVTDPYAKACGINGDRGMVLDFSKTNPERWSDIDGKWDGKEGYDIKAANELSVYEVHIRDLTMDETWTGSSKRGTYSAFSEKGTKYEGLTTGFDHIEEMGANAVQLIPIFDHDDTEDDEHMAFNWGYNPKNYNCLEGGYATSPFDGESRVKEFKQLVYNYATNQNHARIIMDVVYNHVSSVPRSPFHKLMPKYFFRYTESGNLYEGSGCGNEFKTNSKMGRKYVVDSLCWWAKEYNIKGFRFDLMGLIDVNTLAKAKKALYKIDPDIVMYGEGWTGDGSGFNYEDGTIYPVHGGSNEDLGAVTKSVYSLEKLYTTNQAVWLGAFNDTGRNAIRGGNDIDGYHGNHYPNYGFISQGGSDVGGKNRDVFEMIRGVNNNSLNGGGNPSQVVNYASCHDNWTLYDQLHYCLSSDGGTTEPNPNDLMSAVAAVEGATMASNGIAFIQGGEEIFRTKILDEVKDEEYSEEYYCEMYGKKVSHNSYCASDECNSFKWDRKVSVDGVNSTAYCKSIADAIKLHNSMPKYAFDANYKEENIHCWNEGGDNDQMTGGTTLAVQFGDYYFFFNGRNSGGCALPLGNDVKNSTLVFNSRSASTTSVDNTGISFTDKGTWSTMSLQSYQLVIYKK